MLFHDVQAERERQREEKERKKERGEKKEERGGGDRGERSWREWEGKEEQGRQTDRQTEIQVKNPYSNLL